MVYAVIFVFGLFIGSFLNVCIYRLPRVHLTLTDESFANLRKVSSNHHKQKFWGPLLLSICHFWGWYPALCEEPIPPEILTTLEGLKNQEYTTVNDFSVALEEHIGKEQTARYGDLIFKYALSQKESIVLPSSHCPSCNVPIKPWDNIPVMSFLLLRGRCRSCDARISLRYPTVELLTALLIVALVHQFGIAPLTLVYLVFISALIVISFIDLEHQLIPNTISLPGIAAGIMASSFLPISWSESILGAVVGGGIILVTGYVGALVFKKEAMGGGDVKLMAMIGAFLGWKMVFLTIFFGSLAGAVIGIIIRFITGKEYIPFGPFLSIGAVMTLFFGQHLLFWYWTRIFPPL